MSAQLQLLQRELAKVAPEKLFDARAGFLNNLRNNSSTMGEFAVQAIKAQSATQQLTESLVKQDLSFKQAYRSRKMFNDVLREQYQIQRMTAIQWSKDASGTVRADMIVPRGSDASIDRLTGSWRGNISAMREAKAEMKAIRSAGGDATAATAQFTTAQEMLHARMGLVNSVLASGSENLIKWGKNTQWAGRQLMVGFTVPFAAFAAVTGILAYKVDQSMTRIKKVYDLSAESLHNTSAAQAELGALTNSSMNVAAQAAKRYGSSIQDTLDIEAELAATGKRGNELLQSTAAVDRAITLGELDKADAIKGTIALQSVYQTQWEKTGGVAKNTAEAFDYMTAMANATSLTVQDFIQAIPRGAGVMKNLGVDLKGVGLLLVAMKQQGISATEGMNGLRTAGQRLLNVTPAAEKVWKKFTDAEPISKIVEANKGQFIPSIMAIGEAMKKLEPYQRQEIIAKVFGLYQSNKLYAVMDGLINRTGQMQRAYEIFGASAQANADVANNTLHQAMDSMSGRIKKGVAEFKVQLAQMGKPFAEVAGTIIGSATKIISFFNSMPGGVKKFILFGAAFMAIVGPLIMLTGLFANFMGQMLKGVGILASFSNKWRALTAEQKAQELLAKQNSIMWSNQATAAQALSTQINLLTQSLENLAMVNAPAPFAGFTQWGNAVPNYNTNVGGIGPAVPYLMHNSPSGKNASSPYTGSYRRVTPQWVPDPTGTGWVQKNVRGQQASAAEIAALNSANAISLGTEKAERASVTTARNWDRIGARAGQLSLAAGMVGTMASSSNTFVQHLSNALLIMGMLGPMFGSVMKKAIVAVAFNMRVALTTSIMSMKGPIAAMATSFSRVGRGLSAALSGVADVGGPLTLILGAIAFGYYKVNKAQREAVAEQEKVNNSAKDWADILGFVYNDTTVKAQRDKSGGMSALVEQAAALQKAQPGVVKGIADATTEQEKLNRAIQEGIKVYQAGGSSDQAYEAIRTALYAATHDKSLTDALMIKVKGQIDFGNPADIAKKIVSQVDAELKRIRSNDFSESTSASIGDALFNTDALNGKSKAAAAGSAKVFMEQFKASSSSEQYNLFAGLEDVFGKQQTALFNKLYKEHKKEFDKNHITDMTKVAAYTDIGFGGAIGINSKDLKQIRGYQEAEQEFARQLLLANGYTKDQVKNIYTLDDARAALAKSTTMASTSIAQAQDDYANAMMHAGESGQKLTKVEQLALLNTYRRAAGLKDATSIQQGFSESVDNTTKVLDSNGRAIDANAMSIDDYKKAVESAFKDIYSGAQSDVLSQADSMLSQHFSDEIDAITKNGQKKQDAIDKQSTAQDKVFEKKSKDFESRWKKLMKDHDDKWQKAIDVEKKANDERQKMFEAEKSRLERLAQIGNSRIDFNVALNTGNLDEAAKVYNNMQAQQDSWALDDASKNTQSISDVRVAALEKQRDAEQQFLDDKKQREQDALDAEKQRYKDSVDAQKKALEEQTKNAEDAAKKQQEIKKRELDNELLSIRASIPRNQAEYNKQMDQIKAAYEKYGDGLKISGNEWAGIIGASLTAHINAARASLQNDVNWAATGAAIANQVTEGAFGLSAADWAKWVTTGQMPKGGLHPGSAKGATTSGGLAPRVSNSNRRSGSEAAKYYHTGGIAGKTEGGRAGIAGSASPWSSEVPAVLKYGEGILNNRATKFLGEDFIHAANSGRIPKNIGGPDLMGLPGVIFGSIAGMMRQAVTGSIMQASAKRMAQDGSAPTADSGLLGGLADIGRALYALRMHESGGNYTAHSPFSDASGAYQYISTTWNGYKGYPTAADAPAAIQDERARQDLTRSFEKYGNWEQVFAAHFYPAWAGDKSKWNQSPGVGNPTVWEYVNDIMRRMGMSGNDTLYAKVGLNRPLAGPITSRYGMRVNPVTGVYKLHDGTDIAAPFGSLIHAAAAGRVARAGYASGYGNWTVIDHPGGIRTGYAHQNAMFVRAGDRVLPGEGIGTVGMTGNTTGPHLHFMTGKNGQWLNPGLFIPGLAKGGYTLSDGIAKLHKSETVLTAPLSAQLQSGIQKIDQGVHNGYNVTIDLRGAYIREDVDIEKAVYAALEKKENKLGRNRSIK